MILRYKLKRIIILGNVAAVQYDATFVHVEECEMRMNDHDRRIFEVLSSTVSYHHHVVYYIIHIYIIVCAYYILNTLLITST